MVRKIILGASTIIGTTIGAGIFGIPYVISKSGLLIGMIHIILIGLIMMITLLYLGEISLRTKENYHLTGYAKKYINEKGKIIMLLSLAFGIYSAIIAYLIGVGESLSYLFFNTDIHSVLFGVLFWLILSIISFKGIKALQEGEFLGVTIIIFLVISIAIFFSNKIKIINLIQQTPTNPINYFIPFGVILFAFLGYTTIPEVKKIMGNKKNRMKPAIILSIIISALIYIIFTIIVIGFKGINTPQIATIALGKPFILLGIFTMFTSYLALSIALMDMLRLDFNQTKFKAWFFTISLSLITYLILTLTKTAQFTKVLGLGGVISGGLTAILILLMAEKAKYKGDRIPEYTIRTNKLLTIILIIIFIIGTITELIGLF